MREYTFEENGVRITVRTLSHKLLGDYEALTMMLGVDKPSSETGLHPAVWSERRQVVDFLVYSKSVEGLPIDWPSSRAWTDEALKVQTLLFTDEGTYDALISKWIDAIDRPTKHTPVSYTHLTLPTNREV